MTLFRVTLIGHALGLFGILSLLLLSPSLAKAQESGGWLSGTVLGNEDAIINLTSTSNPGEYEIKGLGGTLAFQFVSATGDSPRSLSFQDASNEHHHLAHNDLTVRGKRVSDTFVVFDISSESSSYLGQITIGFGDDRSTTATRQPEMDGYQFNRQGQSYYVEVYAPMVFRREVRAQNSYEFAFSVDPNSPPVRIYVSTIKRSRQDVLGQEFSMLNLFQKLETGLTQSVPGFEKFTFIGAYQDDGSPTLVAVKSQNQHFTEKSGDPPGRKIYHRQNVAPR